MTNEQVFFKKRDILIIAVIVLVAIGSIFAYKEFQKKEGFLTAVITVDGKKVKTLKLKGAPDAKLYLDEGNVWFEIKDEQIAFIDVDCPDKICQNTGFLKKAGDTAICMPKKVILKLINSNETN
ncbi:MAG: NusG domain II-containing protein [Oscillospiraceae bacterium]